MCGPSTCSIEISVMGSHGRGLVVFTPLFCTPQFRGISVHDLNHTSLSTLLN